MGKDSKSVFFFIDQPSGGGAESICRSLSDGLLTRGWKTKIFYLQNPQKTKLLGNEYCLRRPIEIISFLINIRNLIKSNPEIILHAHLAKWLYLLPVVNFLLPNKMFYTEHNTHNRRREIFFFKFLDNFFYSKYNKIICISEGAKKSLLSWTGSLLKNKIEIIYNGIDVSKFINFENDHSKNYKKDSKIKLISVGSLTNQKGFDISINMISKWKNRNWTYEIFGEGQSFFKLQKLIVDNGLEGNIFLKGFCKNVLQEIARSDIVLIPSRWEGFGLVALEALLLKKLIVASDVDGMNEILGGLDTVESFKFSDRNYEMKFLKSLEKSVNKLYSFSHEVFEKSFLHAKKFDRQIMVLKYEDLFRSA